MAIEESQKSVPEHTNKTDPLVGAIVATVDGKILAKAHRGELRIGEHCEFTLLERKLRDSNLRGCVLYVTLEPCTDDSRKTPKRGCSTHIVKARFNKVYIGIEDPNPKIATQGIKYLESAGITVQMFPDHLEQIIRQNNTRFIEEKNIEALQARQAIVEPEKDILEKETIGKDTSSFSSETIQKFIQISEAPLSYPSNQFNEWAEEFQFIKRTVDGVVPTGLGLMLFGLRPENQFPQTIFKVEINYGKEKAEIRDFKGPLVRQLPEILDFVKDKALKITINRDNGVRTEQEDFPFVILREAIANAIIHRDYSIEGATNYLYIDSDTIILRSPGEPMKPLTLDDLRNFDTPSLSRNPKIMYIFNQMKLAEQRGMGLRNMRSLPQQGFPLPIFDNKAGSLQITFGRTKKFIATNAGLNKESNEDDNDLLLFMQTQSEISVADYANYSGINTKTVQRRLAKLVDLGLVETIGGRRWTKYKLKYFNK